MTPRQAPAPSASIFWLRWIAPLVLGLSASAGSGLTWAQSQAAAPAIFKDADLVLGRQLMAQHQCEACHTRRVGGDGTAIYKPAGRINGAGVLRGMVEQCNLELNLALFPEEVTAISAVLNRDHYRFSK